MLAFDEHIGGALSPACQQSFDKRAVHLAKAAEILRRDILNRSYTFTGTFQDECQAVSVPSSLSLFFGMLLEGANIENQNAKSPQNVLSIIMSINHL